MKTFLYIFTLLSVLLTAHSCGYKELPPKTDNISANYILPQGEVPTEAELMELEKIKAEYNEAVK